MDTYYQKYIKYKRKYLNMKGGYDHQQGGNIEDRIYQLPGSPIDIKGYNKMLNMDLGEYSIKDIMTTKKFMHLQFVYQQGIAKFCKNNLVKNNGHMPITRQEHSIGVSILAYHLAKISQPDDDKYIIKHVVCGLLHDISHTIFSHIIDHAMNMKYHEERREEILKAQDDLLVVLQKFEDDGYLNIEQDIMPDAPQDMTILKAVRPNINCDRLDYFFRDGYLMGFFSQTQIARMLSDLTVDEGIVSYKTPDIAKEFFEGIYDITVDEWGGPVNTISYAMFGSIVKDALDKKIIEEMELLTGKDEEIFQRLMKKYGNQMDVIVNQKYSVTMGPTGEYEIYIGRIVDPRIVGGKHLSSYIPAYHKFKMDRVKMLKAHYYTIKVES